MYGADSETATEAEERHGEENTPRRRSQGVNICFIAAALQPDDGLILVCRATGTQTPPRSDRGGAHLARVLKGHGVYNRRKRKPVKHRNDPRSGGRARALFVDYWQPACAPLKKKMT